MIAISTAYKEALIGIKIKDKEICTTLDSNCKHSENLLKTIDEKLSEINYSFKDNKTMAVVIGPGSFTGLRISISLIKGLYCGSPFKIVPITTFELLAYSYVKHNSPKEDFCCIINALSGYFYKCCFNKNGEKIGQEELIDSSQLKEIKIDIVGLKEDELFDQTISPTAEELLQLALIKEKNDEFLSDLNNLIPLYLRKSQAEDDLEQKIKNS